MSRHHPIPLACIVCCALILGTPDSSSRLLGAEAATAAETETETENTAQAENAATIASVQVDPPAITLRGSEDTYSILVHGYSEPVERPENPAGDRESGDRASGEAAASQDATAEDEGNERAFDLTHAARYLSLHPEIVAVTPRGVVRGLADGQGTVEVEVAGKKLHVKVDVKEFNKPREFHFENDILTIITRFGCNSSGCHAAAEGQGGFKLSVFGFDAAGDYDALVKQARGRRVSVAAPEVSLVLRKATNQVPHGGGQRLTVDSWAYATLHGWMVAGLPVGGASVPSLESISITPQTRRLRMRGTQQLRVVAAYSDGREVDVTPLAKYQSNNEGLANVDEFGLVTVGKVPGHVAVMASFRSEMNIFQALIPREETIDDYPELAENSFVDQLVYTRLRKLNIVPSEPASDSDYMRRVFLDVIGTLPTAEEARRFLADKRPDRRSRLVDDLLQRPEYATYWALKWADLLRVDRDALGHKDAYAYYRWIRDNFARNRPLDRFVYDILTAEGPADEAPQGNLFKVVKKPGARASTVSQIFLGLRIDCAECHHHPFDRWSQTDYYGMADFFTQLETKKSPRGEFLLAVGNPETKHPRTGKVVYAHPLGTEMPDRSPSGDRRLVLAKWMTAPENPWFARNLANRLWAHFMGRGLVEPVDDVRATNPPSNADLLDSLTQHFVETGFDMHALIRTITRSRVYQHSSSPNNTNENDEQNYSRALLKPLEAEVLLDALCQATGIPEKFEGVSSGHRAIELWDSQVHHYFLGLFGRPSRKSACECERVSEPNVAQVLHLMNSPSIDDKLTHDGGTVIRLDREIEDDAELVKAIYLNFYTRYPDAEETEVALQHIRSATAGRRQAAVDIAWSLLNSLEFSLNH